MHSVHLVKSQEGHVLSKLLINLPVGQVEEHLLPDKYRDPLHFVH